MKSLLIGMFFCFAFVLSINAQDDPKPVYDRNNMTAMYNIGTNLSVDEIENCAVRKYTGKILSVSEEYPDVTTIIKTPKFKEYISVNTETMSMADRSNFFYSLLKAGKTVQITAYMCGSGGFLYATSVKTISVSVSKRKKKQALFKVKS